MNGEVRNIDGHQVYGSVQNGVFYSQDGTLLVKADGTVEHGHTDGQGYFHSQRTVDGQVLYGSDTGNGGWISDDGKVAIDPSINHGNPQHGITDPVTHQFLANGEVRGIDGHQVYGSVQNGVFYSEDGTLLVKADGTVEHGHTDGQGYFHSQRTVDGQVLYGRDTTDGGWISDDGTVAIDKSGKVEHGVSTPDGKFLPGGTTHTLPDGTVLYGSNTGGDFYSWDGTTIVLSNGTVLHGSTDQNTGIFTPDGGPGVDLITNNGILQGTYNPDGSIAFSDGTTYMTPQAWRIDLPALLDAIRAVERERDKITTTLDQIGAEIRPEHLETIWRGPSRDSFDPVREWYTDATNGLMSILDEIIVRMSRSYYNYLQAESANLQNMTPTGTTTSQNVPGPRFSVPDSPTRRFT
ncbi:MAG TPA: hypothetical protein VNW94_00810 [Streptosporangiaceae bacterium]|nr:hypothetical protein [Streptosporangiaceae bacterium]